MSIKLMTAAWDYAPAMNHIQFLVYLALCDQASDEGSCWPAMGTIARRARTTPRNARKCILALERLQLVERVAVAGHANTYRIYAPSGLEPLDDDTPVHTDPPTPVHTDPPHEDTDVPRSTRTAPPVHTDRPPGPHGPPTPVHTDRPPRSTRTAITVIEPSLNHQGIVKEPAHARAKNNGNLATAEAERAEPNPPPLRAAPPVLPELPESWRGGGWPAAWAYAKSGRGKAHLDALARTGRVSRTADGEYGNAAKAIAYRQLCDEQGLDCRI